MNDINEYLEGKVKVSKEKNSNDSINEATVEILKAYLDYAGQLVREILNKQSYDFHFKEIDDDLVLKPDELITLINKIQNALYLAKD